MASDAKKILLVEDEKAIRDAVAAYLAVSYTHLTLPTKA